MPAKKKISPDTTPEPVTPEVPAAEPSAESTSDQATLFAAAPVIVPPAQPVPPVVPTVQPLSSSDERTWAMISHLSVLLNLMTGFGGPIAAFIIYLVYKDRSRYVAYHSLQSAIMQLIWWFGAGTIAGFFGAMAGIFAWTVVIPIVCGPLALLALLLPLGALIYGVIGGVQTSQGQDFKYWLIGDWVRGTLTGQ